MIGALEFACVTSTFQVTHPASYSLNVLFISQLLQELQEVFSSEAESDDSTLSSGSNLEDIHFRRSVILKPGVGNLTLTLSFGDIDVREVVYSESYRGDVALPPGSEDTKHQETVFSESDVGDLTLTPSSQDIETADRSRFRSSCAQTPPSPAMSFISYDAALPCDTDQYWLPGAELPDLRSSSEGEHSQGHGTFRRGRPMRSKISTETTEEVDPQMEMDYELCARWLAQNMYVVALLPGRHRN